jgi:hypothetical protein
MSFEIVLSCWALHLKPFSQFVEPSATNRRHFADEEPSDSAKGMLSATWANEFILIKRDKSDKPSTLHLPIAGTGYKNIMILSNCALILYHSTPGDK